MSHLFTPSTPLGIRVATLMTGYGFKKVEEIILDHIVYSLVVAYCLYLFGPTRGGLISLAVMGTTSALVCLCYVWVYDKLRIDWFGFESLKELREENAKGGLLRRFLVRMAEKGDLVALFALSVVFDPFMTTVYLRKGNYDGLTQRDKRIFWSSVLISNGYWTLRWVLVVEGLFYLFELLPSNWQRGLTYALAYAQKLLN